jgi:glycosyltransferase involved in cell wall biosynthesis
MVVLCRNILLPNPVSVESLVTQGYRILCVGETWFGSDGRAAFSALRRLGHSVMVLDENHYVPGNWQSKLSKGIRKLGRPLFVRELMFDAVRVIQQYKPQCLFVFKGNWVHPDLIRYCKQRGIVSINYYPDVSFQSHGPYIPKALPEYDHIFNTKSYGVTDMRSQQIQQVSFVAPGYDPELHCPVSLADEDKLLYGCDVAFVGTWSPKKERYLSTLREALPDISVKIWGNQWEKSSERGLRGSIMGYGVIGDEYTKAIRGAAICLGLLSEIGKGASSGDLITARTFQIPACGTFMLHERNDEVLSYFKEGRDAAFFGTPAEMGEKVRYYLDAPDERARIAQMGLQRSVESEYAIDGRMEEVMSWLNKRLKGYPKN